MEVTVNEHIRKVLGPSIGKLQFHKGDYIGMKEKLSGICWEEILKDQDIEGCWDTFKSIMLELQNEFIPQVVVGTDSKPKWIDKNVVSALNDKKRAWKKYYFCRSVEDFEKYKVLRNKVRIVIMEARRNMEKKIALEVKGKPKSFWNYVSRRTKPSDELNQVRNTEGELTQSNKETAKCLNKYFASVFTKNQDIVIPQVNQDEGLQMPNIVVEEKVIMEILKNLKADKAMGADGLSPRMLWETTEYIAKALAKIFNASLQQGRIPLDWKEAIVVPGYMKGRRDMPENYRLFHYCEKPLR